tara:strand:+ start:11329 stop:11928 length:600 start_codon:yes stop_codon:yes gene_type:complete
MDEAMTELFSDMTACQTIENLLRGKPPPKPTVQKRAPRGMRRGLAAAKAAMSQTTAVTRVVDRSVEQIVSANIEECKTCRKRHLEVEEQGKEPVDDDTLSQLAQFTDGMDLKPYESFLHYVPRLVNVVRRAVARSRRLVARPSELCRCRAWQVTLAEALPMPGSGLKLPLDLAHIAARCRSAYYAPRRFAVSNHSNPTT